MTSVLIIFLFHRSLSVVYRTLYTPKYCILVKVGVHGQNFLVNVYCNFIVNMDRSL
jgi:hypothetical protein